MVKELQLLPPLLVILRDNYTEFIAGASQLCPLQYKNSSLPLVFGKQIYVKEIKITGNVFNKLIIT
jgi:hypothetical protein